MTVHEMRKELQRALSLPRSESDREIRFWYHSCQPEIRTLVDKHPGTIRQGVRAALEEFPP